MKPNKQHRWGNGLNQVAANSIQEALDAVWDRKQRSTSKLELQLLTQTHDHLKSAMQRLIAADKQI